MKSILLLAFLSLMAMNGLHAQVPQNPEDISPLLIGENIPEASLKDATGAEVSLAKVLKEKPTVLVFYRGGWCPYCNAQLSGLAKVEAEVLNLGYQIVAISPEDYQNLNPTIEQEKVGYQLYADPRAQLIQAMGIAFQINGPTKGYMQKRTLGEATEILPVPTVMVVNTKGEILFEYINPHYQTRMSEKLLLAVLQSLQ